MRKDFKFLVVLLLLSLTVVFCGLSYMWYQRRQATWLGINLDELGRTKNETEARAILRAVMTESCRHRLAADHDPNKPMLFQGGALSSVDLECMDEMERLLEKKMVRIAGVDPSKVPVTEVGFLGVKKFAKPPPQRKNSRWKRKKAWKFFREDAVANVNLKAVPLQGSPVSPESTEMDASVSQSEAQCDEAVPLTPDRATDPSPPSKKAARRKKKTARQWIFAREEPFESPEVGIFGFFSTDAADTAESKAS